MKNLLKSNWFLITMSILSAIVIWIYVVYEIEPMFETTIKDVPISYTRYSDKFSNGKLVLSSKSRETANIRIKGKRGELVKINKDDISCTVDMSGVNTSGTHKIPVSVYFNVSGMEVVSKDPYSVSVDVDDVITKELNIKVETTGVPAESFIYDSIEYAHDKVRITGAKNILSNVKRARVTVDISGKTEPVSGRYKIILLDKDGNEVEEEGISKNISYIEVTCNILQLKEIKITPDLSIAERRDKKKVTATVNPSTVKILGNKNLVSGLTEILTMPIDVRYVKNGDKIKIKLTELPEKIKFEEDPEEIEVTLKVE